MRNFILIGLTGPTGSGKSTISNFLKEKGCFVLDGDKVARQALEKASSCLFQLSVVFGEDIIMPDGTANRKLIAQRAFSTPENTKKLNQITHPWITLKMMEEIDKLRNEHDYPIIIIDAAAIFESNIDIMCDYMISALADEDIRIQRILKRDKITFEQAKQRITAQKSDSFYKKRSDYVIYNNTTKQETILQAEKILGEIIKKEGR